MDLSSECHSAQLRDGIRDHLATHERLSVSGEGRREAAVVIALTPDAAGRSTLLLTRRAGHLRRHRGQWALPGGRIDEGEDAVSAALRELREELGVAMGREQVLGRLDDYASRSGYRIFPVIAWSDSAVQLEPDPGEVAAVYRVPLGELSDAVPSNGKPHGPLPCLDLLETQIFAPTAALLFQFVEVALRARSTRVESFGEPSFAWR